MKTWPIKDAQGRMFAFEVAPPMLLTTLQSLLNTIPDVCRVEVRRFLHTPDDVHIRFTFQDQPFVVWEFYGDSSRYWIGPESESGVVIDVTSIEARFREH